MKNKIGLLASMLLATTQVSASELAMHTHQGTNYAEVNLGTNLYYLGIISHNHADAGGGIGGIGWGFGVGHYFTNIFALEGGFLQSIISVNDGNFVNAPYFTTRFSVPINERFNFIGKIGAMYPNGSGEGGFVWPFTGIGFSYAATDKIDWNMQYQGAFYGILGAGIASVGLTYHFN